MKIAAVLFDLDGTLADTAPDLGDALNRLLEEEGRAALPQETIRRYASHGAKGLLGCGFGTLAPAEETRLMERFFTLYEQNLCVKTRLFPGAEETLAALGEHDIARGVVTNKSMRFAEPILRALGMHDTMDCLIYGDTTAHKKPAPDALLLAAERLKITPRDCLYVGDSERDVAAARAAGMPVLAAAYGYEAQHTDVDEWGCDGVVDTLGEVAAWVRAKSQ